MKRKSIFLISLMFLTLMSIYGVSGTMAKYVSSVDISDEARVAKWDIGITREIDLFRDSYFNEQGAKMVESGNLDAIVAPGTEGEYTFTITGIPETNYTLRIEVLEALDTVGRMTYSLDGIYNNLDIKTLKFFLENLLREEDVYPANKPLKVNQHTISWKWNFYEDDEMDSIDTSLGESAISDHESENYNDQPMVKLKIKVIAEQSTKEANVNLN